MASNNVKDYVRYNKYFDKWINHNDWNVLIVSTRLIHLLINEILKNDPLPLWGFPGIMRQLSQMEHNMVKNPSC